MRPEHMDILSRRLLLKKTWTPLECRMHYSVQSMVVLLRILATQQPKQTAPLTTAFVEA
jgi:hypothetical protein